MNFADPGVWVWQVVNCDYNRIKAIADAGFRWIAIQICSGQQAVRTGNYQDLIESARSLGLDVAGFGWCVDSPVEEAETADRLLEAWKLDGFIANGEQPLNYTQNGGACPDCFNYSSQWTERWKQLRGSVGIALPPSFPLGFSSFADFSRHDIHYTPWIEIGAVAMPQVYWNEFAWASPNVGVAGALDVKQPWNGPPYGWPCNRIHVTFANYKSGANPIPTPKQYAESLLKTSARGFSVYLGELISQEDFAAYKTLIPSISQVSLPPLSESELPYTGPYYGPGHSKGPDKNQTVKALKRALWRLGVEPAFSNPDEHYNAKLENAMARWQRTSEVRATGQYGRGSWEALRSAFAPDGSHAMDSQCQQWVKEDHAV